jgi:aspartate aminotransferase
MPEPVFAAPAAVADRPAPHAADPATGAGGAHGVAHGGGLVGSEILKIAAEIRGPPRRRRDGVQPDRGRLRPGAVPHPAALEEGIVDALRAGETNYPPSSGIDALRAASARSGAPASASSTTPATCSSPAARAPDLRRLPHARRPGERVVYPVPSWNNNHYVHQSAPRACGCRAARERFLPTADQSRRSCATRRCGSSRSTRRSTRRDDVHRRPARELCDVVLARTAAAGAATAPLLLYDQVYWTLTFGGARHVDPVRLRPAMRDYTVYVDGISKAFAATGVRVAGWPVPAP